MDSITKEEHYLRARKRADELKIFYIHLLIYTCVNIFLTVIRVYSDIEYGFSFVDLSTYWVWILWGIGVCFHVMRVFELQKFLGNDWEERKIKEFMNQNKRELIMNKVTKFERIKKNDFFFGKKWEERKIKEGMDKHKYLAMKTKLLIALFFIAFYGYSQDSFVIQNTLLFDGDKVWKKASVLVKNGKVAKISKRKIPHTNVIDGTNKTLLPALTNTHVHLWSPLSLQEAAKAGVLNLMDMHGMESVLPIMKKYKSSTMHADFYAAGSAATVPNGHGTQYGFPAPTLTKPEEAKSFVESRIKAGADYIKIIKEPWKATLDNQTVKALIDATHLNNKKAIVHVSRVKDGYQVLKDKADGLAHIWQDSVLTKKQLKSLKEEKFFVIPTLLTMQRMQETFYKRTKIEALKRVQAMKKEVKRLYDIGVPILAGTDPPNANINYGTDLYKEMILLSEAGIPILDVLKSATSLPVKHFNLENKGFIKIGYRADLILVEGNLIENIKNIMNNKKIFKQGKEVK